MAITAVYVKDTESDSQIGFLRKRAGNLRKRRGFMAILTIVAVIIGAVIAIFKALLSVANKSR